VYTGRHTFHQATKEAPAHRIRDLAGLQEIKVRRRNRVTAIAPSILPGVVFVVGHRLASACRLRKAPLAVAGKGVKIYELSRKPKALRNSRVDPISRASLPEDLCA